jgi:hypothetical protein
MGGVRGIRSLLARVRVLLSSMTCETRKVFKRQQSNAADFRTMRVFHSPAFLPPYLPLSHSVSVEK